MPERKHVRPDETGAFTLVIYSPETANVAETLNTEERTSSFTAFTIVIPVEVWGVAMVQIRKMLWTILI